MILLNGVNETFIPKYERRLWFSIIITIVVILFLIVISIIFSAFKVLLFAFLLLLILAGIFLNLAKCINFGDRIVIQRYFFKEVILNYEDIEYVGVTYLKTTTIKLGFTHMINASDLITLLNQKMKNGLIPESPNVKEFAFQELRSIGALKLTAYITVPILIAVRVAHFFDLSILKNNIFNLLIILIPIGTYFTAWILFKKRN